MAGDLDLFYGLDGRFIVASIGIVITMLVALLGCTWCRGKWRKFREHRHYRLSGASNPTPLPPVQNVTEFTIFPPQSGFGQFIGNAASATIPDEIVFEPLPEIRSRVLQAVAQNVRPARFTGSSRKVSLQDWFDDIQHNFPRNQLKYLREVGSGWYGQAVEGEAYNITPDQEKTKVVVKILRVDASVLEHMHFLHEARPFRDLHHPNMLHLLGRCLEVHPFLLIMEHCDMDLKTCLIELRKTPEVLLKDGLLLRMACNIASALQHMHEHGYIHTDVAAHSCVVTADLSVKVGDYGTALHTHKSDYYCLGDIAFPLRWCAPESILCTESIVEAKDVTREANVWSFGILMWELLEFGKLPYMDLSDEEVVQKIIIECCGKLEQPKTPCVHKDMIYKIMQLCWLPASHRPTIQKIITLLNYLYDNKDVVSESAAFESRWNSLQPVLRDYNFPQQPLTHIPLRFESDFNLKDDNAPTKGDCDSIMSSEFSPSQYGDKSPSHCSLSTGYEGELSTDISPSLQNLRGSIDDLSVVSINTLENDCNGDKINATCGTEQDVTQERITEAIRDLDIVLAGELTSSETSKCTTPEKAPQEDVSPTSPLPMDKVVANYTPNTNGTDTVPMGKNSPIFNFELEQQKKITENVLNCLPFGDSILECNQEKHVNPKEGVNEHIVDIDSSIEQGLVDGFSKDLNHIL